MSGHKYIGNNKLFDDVDDETFLRNSRHSYNPPPSFEEQKQSFIERKQEIEDRTIKSTERSISLLRDSEQVGIATAEELMRQREQLERTDKRLDEINQTLRFSQKHINGIKSVFSSLKSYISGRNDSSPSISTGSSNTQTTNSTIIENKVSEYDRYENHPTTRLRNPEPDSFQQGSSSKNFSARLDANLQEMHSSISKLKGLASDLSYEIDSQNDLIGDIIEKTDVADVTIVKQNKEMHRILQK
ncbi:hypothetical protein PPYR_03099 [Photinus pyralis]|uniref:t-SNARE coiled-coil homology domain-containing protein n=1 Tax=Photinus pyralis TaxID=7054 RepID=A0A1Y1L1E9_PHOPY|nr:synaptosomal-associated protein 29 [Photinus pyralis]KAB0791299.1 hypothetical protein PPYR_03099 [Photinus pyralis]